MRKQLDLVPEHHPLLKSYEVFKRYLAFAKICNPQQDMSVPLRNEFWRHVVSKFIKFRSDDTSKGVPITISNYPEIFINWQQLDKNNYFYNVVSPISKSEWVKVKRYNDIASVAINIAKGIYEELSHA
jgi:hypothetical protein